MNGHEVFKRGHAEAWTPARISALSKEEIKQLRDNAERLNEPSVAELCRAALKEVPSTRGRKNKSRTGTKAGRLIARVKAFEARGVFLQDAHTSWGGVRKADGAVVMAMWSDAVELAEGGCRYLLWAPNVDGSRPWSDKAAGRERLEHCKRAMALGTAEGLLVYGQSLAAQLPEERALSIHGADAETVVIFEVEQVGAEFWAKWGKKAAASAIQRN